MTSRLTGITSGLARQWARIYTMGLPTEIKTARLDEIDSDLWEQTQDASLVSRQSNSVTKQMLGRMLFGMPDDLSWRIECSKESGRGDYMYMARYLIRPRTYINLVAVLISMAVLLPVGIAAFVTAVVASVVPPVLLSSVFTFRLTELNFGSFVVDTLPKAIIVSLVGLVLVLLEIFIANYIVSILRRFVSFRIGNVRLGQIA